MRIKIEMEELVGSLVLDGSRACDIDVIERGAGQGRP